MINWSQNKFVKKNNNPRNRGANYLNLFEVVFVQFAFLPLFISFVEELALILGCGPNHKEAECYKEQKYGVAYKSHP
jgi:hypothetical protein